MKILVGGPIHTMVEGQGAGEPCEALAWNRGRIVAVGRRAEVEQAAGDGAEVRDLAGQTVVPGFTDAHHHISLGVVYDGALDVGPQVAPTLNAVLARLKTEAARLPAGRWLVARGFDEFQLPEGRHPRRDELDAACPDHPLLLMHFTMHEAVLSSRGLEQVGIDRHTPDPPGGRILSDWRGRPTGRLLERAMMPAEIVARADLLARDREGFFQRLHRYERRLFAAGVTRVGDGVVPPDVEELLLEARRRGALRIPVVPNPSGPGYLDAPWTRLDGAPTGAGDEEHRVGPLKLLFDGGAQCALCLGPGHIAHAMVGGVRRLFQQSSLDLMRALAAARPRLGRDLKVRTGMLFYPDSEAQEIVNAAVERGFGVAIHAIGNDAVAQAATVLAQVAHRHPAALPPRIEHAMVITDDLIPRIADAGIMAVVQPGFIDVPAFASLPIPRGLRVVPLRRLLDAGVRLAGSSDAPVVSFAPLDGIRAAVTRVDSAGRSLQPQEAITSAEALVMYTREAARATGSLDCAGTLEVGKRADLVILSGDPTTATAAELTGIVVEETLLAGETVYRRTEAAI